MTTGSAPRPTVSLGSSTKSPATSGADVLVAGVTTQMSTPGSDVSDAMGRGFAPLLSTLGFEGRSGQVAQVPTPDGVRAPLLVAVGLGEPDSVDAEGLRRAAANAVRAVHNAASMCVSLPADEPADLQAVVEGIGLGAYVFDRYKSDKTDEGPRTVMVLTPRPRSADARAALERGRVVTAAVTRARDWVNTPAGMLTPPVFADEVAAAAKDLGAPNLSVRVWDKKKLAAQKCGGILGVGAGSDSPPRLVQISYEPKKAVAHLALVGKGITFDSGGLSLKPGASMMTMKCDMAGAAAVLAATFAIAELGLPVRVTCLAAMAENMVSGSATRPGDVLTIRGGTTVEVHNTDAEGRLVLADALVLATEAAPDLVVDVATLTGACVVALGDRTAGVLSNDDTLRRRLPDIAATAGESLWPLPITEELKARVTSSAIADLRQHNPKPIAGTLYAAAFLREFVGNTRWAHLDIAGPAFNDGTAFDYTPTGGTGAGVRTLVALAGSLAAGELGD